MRFNSAGKLLDFTPGLGHSVLSVYRTYYEGACTFVCTVTCKQSVR